MVPGAGRKGRVQIRYETDLTDEAYVIQGAWRAASLERCPWHAAGGCGFKRHGTYPRLEPPGTRIARWYCPKARATVSLLPDCLAAKMSGSLASIEGVLAEAEGTRTVEAAADAIRPDVELPGGLRWLRRRMRLIYAGLLALRTLAPEIFGECAPTVLGFRERLGLVAGAVLPALRSLSARHLHALPAPLGFGPPPSRSLRFMKREQQEAGARAPPARS